MKNLAVSDFCPADRAVLTHWQTVADAVVFDSTSTIDSFNADIHKEILAHEKPNAPLAFALTNIKYQLNKRYYEATKGDGR